MRARRQRIEPTHDWAQISPRTDVPEQLLFGQPVPERAQEIGVPQSTLYRQVSLFRRDGVASLIRPPKVEKHHRLPEEVRRRIVMLKAEHPAFRPHEIARICELQFGRRPSPHTVKRILAENPVLVGDQRVVRQYPPYHEMPVGFSRRRAVVDLHFQGWTVQSVSEYLGVSRQTVHQILKRWAKEGPAGLEDRSSAPQSPARKVDLRAMSEVARLQKNPYLGAFRVHAALEEIGIHLSRATCGRIMAHNRKLYGLPKPEREPKEPKSSPFCPERRHQYWFCDIRYVDNDHLGYRTYSITILEGFSRLILYSALSRSQTSLDFLRVLHSAVRQYGAPEQLVSDRGGQFLSNEAQRVYGELDIVKREIERRQAWENLIESQFNVQRRMADWRFAEARSWEELVEVHDQWVLGFNLQAHYAHQKREDGRRSPSEVLGWIRGREFAPEDLDRIFRGVRYERRLDRLGYARFRHWRVYGEEALSGERAALWVSEDTLVVEHAAEKLAVYRVRWHPDHKHIHEMREVELLAHSHVSLQPRLYGLDDVEWLKALRLPGYRSRRKGDEGFDQDYLFSAETPGDALPAI
ncbi:MAG: helix-turn-helix domain-containing protein [Chloroflexota bacterium]|nr:helix-turn-helix domain-containing protein [Chloroflexota bacterium]